MGILAEVVWWFLSISKKGRNEVIVESGVVRLRIILIRHPFFPPPLFGQRKTTFTPKNKIYNPHPTEHTKADAITSATISINDPNTTCPVRSSRTGMYSFRVALSRLSLSRFLSGGFGGGGGVLWALGGDVCVLRCVRIGGW